MVLLAGNANVCYAFCPTYLLFMCISIARRGVD